MLNPKICADAIMSKIFELGEQEDGSVLFNGGSTVQSLVICVAMILEADPELKALQDIERVSNSVAKDIRKLICAIRIDFEKTGRRPLDWVASNTN